MAGPSFSDLIALRADGDTSFVAPPAGTAEWSHVYGGHVAAQAVAASYATLPSPRDLHSMHAYFVNAGVRDQPVRLEVEVVRDGRSFSVRRVEAMQEGRVVLVLDASFHVSEPGRTWPEPVPIDVPPPEACAGHRSYLSDVRWLEPFELRPVVDRLRPAHPMWVRLAERPAPHDTVTLACALVSISDAGMAGSTATPDFRGRTGPTLDHCLWLHELRPTDEWVLFSARRLANAGSRGLATGTFHGVDGTLLATFNQEVLLRES